MSTNFWFTAILAWLFTFGFTSNGTYAAIISVVILVAPILKNTVQRKRYNDNNFDEQRLKDIEKNMGEPKGIEISAYEERIRRNLLIVSFLALAFICLDLQINSDSKFLGGMTFSNLTPNKVYILLLTIIGYEFIHYLWNLKTSYMHWRIRLTGITVTETRGGSKGGPMYDDPQKDYTGKEQNSNLYVWMFEQALPLSQGINSSLQTLSSKLQDAIKSSEQTPNNPPPSITLKQLEKEAQKLSEKIEELTEFSTSIRIDGSLLRFDQWFRLLVNSQNIRWFFLDVILPLLLALAAISLLLCEIDFSTLSL